MNRAYHQVREFHKALDHPVEDCPTMLPEERVANRIYWIKGELEELREADTLVDQVDAVMDAIYFLQGTLVEMGVEPEVCFDAVHRANMAKLFPDGKPRYREEDGKIIKPSGWKPPEPTIQKEIDRQRREYYGL